MTSSGSLRAVFPGSFDPPTQAHVTIALAAINQLDLVRLDFAVSKDTLGKSPGSQSPLEDRVRILLNITQRDRRLGVLVTPDQLLSDISQGYDFLIVGEDKLIQLQDPQFYTSSEDMQNKLQTLPELAVVPRGFNEALEHRLLALEIDVSGVSSTKVRDGHWEMAAEESRAFYQEKGSTKRPRGDPG